jgi:hypothetical protein
VVLSPKLVRKLFLPNFPDSFILRRLWKCEFLRGIAGQVS